MKNKVEQENLCLKCKVLIDQLRTTLFEISDFDNYSYWDKRLKHLKSKVDGIYWRI